MEKKIKIVSDGTCEGTHVYYGDEEIKNVSAVSIYAQAGDSVKADITIVGPILDVVGILTHITEEAGA